MTEVEDDLHEEMAEVEDEEMVEVEDEEMAEVEDDLHEEMAEVEDDLHEEGMKIDVAAKKNRDNLLFEGRGLVQLQLDSFNYFVNKEIQKIVRANNRITSEQDPNNYLRYQRAYIGLPSVIRDDAPQTLTPQGCCLSDMTYAAPIYVDVQYVQRIGDQIETKTKNRVDIGSMPIMLKSCRDVENEKSIAIENKKKIARSDKSIDKVERE